MHPRIKAFILLNHCLWSLLWYLKRTIRTILSRAFIALLSRYWSWIRSRRSRRKSYASRKQSLEGLFSTAT